MNSIEKLASLIHIADNVVFFGGAGVSTESGIPDFRSSDGIYNAKWKDPPERVLSHSYFLQNPALFYSFYREKILFPDAQPNQAHQALAEMEKTGKLKAVITQNIDGLHQRAGNQKVLELHGSTRSNHCMACGAYYPLQKILSTTDVPQCSCGGLIKPDVVLYEESLDNDVIKEAVSYIANCDLLIVGGTSLTVYPAAGFVQYAQKSIAIINKSPTPFDKSADVCIHSSVGSTLYQVMELLPSMNKD